MDKQPLLGATYVNVKDAEAEPLARLTAVNSMEEAEEPQAEPPALMAEDDFLVAGKMRTPWQAAGEAIRHPMKSASGSRGCGICLCATIALAGIAALITALFLGGFTRAGAQPSEPTSLFPPPVTVRFDSNLRTNSTPLALNDPRISKMVGGFLPEQVHLTYVSEDAVYVTWVTGDAEIGVNVQSWDPECVKSEAQVSEVSNNFEGTRGPVYTATSSMSHLYTQSYNFTGGLNYSSGIIHHAKIEGLKPDTTYFYRVGDYDYGYSYEYSFRTLPRKGSFPIRMGVVGDLGQTYNTTSTLAHLEASDVPVLMLVGDFSYADVHLTNDTLNPYVRQIPGIPFFQQSYQPRWDTFGRLMEPILSTTPLIHNHGNHEIEPQYDGTRFSAYNTRYPTPHNESGSESNLYYSFDLGGVHGIMLSSYAPYYPESDQYQWLMDDLAKIDREVTPWVVVSIHAPFYNTYFSHFKEMECMRLAMEPMLYEAGVDLVLTGHVHAYERTNPVYNYNVDVCGPVHITIGDGGNVEGLIIAFVDDEGMCPGPDFPAPFYAPDKCPTFQDSDGGFCPTSQPLWSAYREPSFGHGVLDVVNATHARWQWKRNQDGFATVTDDVWIDRRVDTCPNKRA